MKYDSENLQKDLRYLGGVKGLNMKVTTNTRIRLTAGSESMATTSHIAEVKDDDSHDTARCGGFEKFDRIDVVEVRRDVHRLLAGLVVVVATMSVTVASGWSGWRRHAPAVAPTLLGSSDQTSASGVSKAAENTLNFVDEKHEFFGELDDLFGDGTFFDTII